MHPNVETSKDVSWAITQIENSLKKGNEDTSILKKTLKKNEEKLNILEKKIEELKESLEASDLEAYQCRLTIEQLSNPISLTNLGVQKRLIFLEALEAGGVDDWDGYDEARMKARSID
jgi:chromosome segregation ATPase